MYILFIYSLLSMVCVSYITRNIPNRRNFQLTNYQCIKLFITNTHKVHNISLKTYLIKLHLLTLPIQYIVFESYLEYITQRPNLPCKSYLVAIFNTINPIFDISKITMLHTHQLPLRDLSPKSPKLSIATPPYDP